MVTRVSILLCRSKRLEHGCDRYNPTGSSIVGGFSGDH